MEVIIGNGEGGRKLSGLIRNIWISSFSKRDPGEMVDTKAEELLNSVCVYFVVVSQ